MRGFTRVLVLISILNAFGTAEAGILDTCARLLGGAKAKSVAQPVDVEFEKIAKIWGGIEEFWTRKFMERGIEILPSVLVIYDKELKPIPCGVAFAALGPFYCPVDGKTYIDINFVRDLEKDFGFIGDSVPLYVLAHEYGHHILNLIGTLSKIQNVQQLFGGDLGKKVQVRHELLADALAGFFVGSMVKKNQLNNLDRLHLRLACQNAGDDHVCKVRGVELNISHGAGAQREAWFNKGLHAASLAELDPYSDPLLLGEFNSEQQTIVKYFLSNPLKPIVGERYRKLDLSNIR